MATKKTMTVKDLISALEAYPDEMPVYAEWEGVHAYLAACNFTVSTAIKFPGGKLVPSLIIDVGEY